MRCHPENDSQPPVPKAVPHESATMQEPTEVTGLQGATIAPLPERIDALNCSLDLGSVQATRLGDPPLPGNGADSGLYPTEATNRGDPSCIWL